MQELKAPTPELLEKVMALGKRLDTPGALFRVMTAQELKNLPPIEWLVEGYLPKGGLGVLYGPSGGGKSFVAWGMTCAVNTGRQWFGANVQRGTTLYVAGEGVTGYPIRLNAWERHNRHAILDGFYFNPSPVNLMIRNEVLALLEVMETFPDLPSLVVFDTLRTCMAGGDENSVKDIGTVTGHCRLIQQMTGAAVLLVHHTTKAANVESGSGALRGAADAMINLIPEDDQFLLVVDKQKDGKPADPIALRLIPVINTESCVVGLAEHSSNNGALTKDQRRALRALSNFTEGASRKDWQEACEMKLSAFMIVANALADKGLVHPPDEKPKRYRVSESGHRALD